MATENKIEIINYEPEDSVFQDIQNKNKRLIVLEVHDTDEENKLKKYTCVFKKIGYKEHEIAKASEIKKPGTLWKSIYENTKLWIHPDVELDDHLKGSAINSLENNSGYAATIVKKN